jgi:hypothetical protein
MRRRDNWILTDSIQYLTGIALIEQKSRSKCIRWTSAAGLSFILLRNSCGLRDNPYAFLMTPA